MNPTQKTARIAGLLYLILAITSVYGHMYVSSQIWVRGDDIATTNNILANELLFRTGIASGLINTAIFIFLVLFLYRLFKQVNEHQAKFMVALVIVQVPISFLLVVCKITSLMILKGEVLKALEPEQLQDLAMLFLKIHGYGISALMIYWGLWLIPFGLLVYKSGFIPRIVGGLLIIASIGYIIQSFTFLLLPDYLSLIKKFAMVLFFGELPVILWLLIRGVKVQSTT